MYKEDLALNNKRRMICQKSNQSEPNKILVHVSTTNVYFISPQKSPFINHDDKYLANLRGG